MSYQIIQPCAEFKDYVSHFWAGKWENGEQNGFTYYSTANTQTELAFGFNTAFDGFTELKFSSILGHTKNFWQFPMNGIVDLFGVSLYSYAIPGLFNISALDLANQIVDLDTLLGTEGKMINEKMSNANTTEKRVEILTGYFKSKLTKRHYEDKIIIGATKEIKRHNGIVDIRGLASDFCLSQKQFERRFAEYSSFNPKLYARIIRFETALWDRRSYNTLTEVANAYGYYDQAHFIHDFKIFSGFSPNKFFSLTGH